ncbi:MAG: insulinase family protein [Chlamydiota bacterium]
MTQTFLRSSGEVYRDFKTLTCSKIDELDCFFRELIHTPTGTHVIHIENDDPENLFCLSFRTLPTNSRGAPHILEHTVLCGSKRFPVKDPFFSMTRRSLNTFMNALTGSDFTCYPAASQVEKDFYNLLDVYLDAVFQPELKKESFLQEGCRLEFEEASDSTTPLRFKGIVYNEMKGSLSSADSRMWHAVLEALFPDLSYAHNSGGDPKNIPDLSYEELIEFHKTYYHPSRCLFFFYGNMPLKKHLDYITEKTLQDCIPLSPLPPIPKQPRFKTPRTQTISYPANPEETASQKSMVSFGWVTCPLTEQEEVLALSILDSILADTDASPLKSALLDSGLCTQADAFMDVEMSEVPYVITCRGCLEKDIDALEQVLKTTLLKLSQSPLSSHLVDAAIHQLELSRMEISGDHAPFGLTLFFRSVLAKQHGCDPQKTLQMHLLFDTLLKKVQDPFYLPGLIDKYFVQNTHFVKVIMHPDKELGNKESLEEKALLERKKKALSEKEIQDLIKQSSELEKIQEKEEDQDLSCLPKVTLQDVPVLTRDFPLIKEIKPSLEIFHHDCFTNHIVYADLIFDLPNITDEEIPYLQLLLSILPELGAKNRSYKENLDYMQAHTGGVGVGASLHVQTKDRTLFKPALSIRGRALERKADKLFPLMEDILVAPDLKDVKRITDLIKQLHTSLENRVSKNALRYAIQLSLSGYGQASHFAHGCFGLRYYHFILDITKKMEVDPSFVIDKLIMLHEKICTFHHPELVLSCDRSFYEKMNQEGYLHFNLPKKAFTPWEKSSFPITPVKSQGRIIPAQVAYNVKSFETVSYIHPHAPALMVATQLLDNKVLHTKIREIGGAYGSGASYSATLGAFYFHSHRDPHIASTFSAFDESIDAIVKGQFTEQDLEEAKLGIIQQFDTPIPPNGRAILAYGWLRDEKTLELRQKYRDAILSLTKKQIKQVVEIELLLKKEQAINISFASKELLEKENITLAKKQKELPVFNI